MGRVVGRYITPITYRGRKSGRTFTLPVGYRRARNTVTIGVELAERKKWWRNFLGDGGPLTIRLDGVDRTGHAVARRTVGSVRSDPRTGRPGVSRPDGDAAGIDPEVAPRDEEETFDRTVDEGRQRLGRSWLQLIATGLLGGLDVGVGVLALLLVEHLTGDPLLSALAFAAGFIALTHGAQ